jgi:tetratricopeptide (TPR) repeat protein
VEYFAKAKLAVADIFSKEMSPAKTIETYQSIIDNSEDFKRDAYLKIAKVYRESRDYEKEVAAYQNALLAEQRSSGVTNAELHFMIGDTYELLNQLEKAVDAYLKVPYLAPDEKRWVVKAYLRVGRIFENQERWSEAASTYRKVVAFETDESKFAQERIDWIGQNESL